MTLPVFRDIHTSLTFMKQTTLFQLLAVSLLGAFSLPIPGEAIAASSVPFPNPQPSGTFVAQAAVPDARPYIWPAQGRISKGYVPEDYHPGIDIENAAGTEIYAAASGVVTYARWNDFGYGNYIKIRHADGNYTIYGHNQEILVKEGQQVRQGQPIALMGNTGFVERPHLHFEIRPGDDGWIDPMTLLPALVAGQIPQHAVASVSDRSTLPSLTPPVQSAQFSGRCAGTALIEGETAQFRVKLCREGGQFFYFGQSKQDPSRSIWRPARALGGDRYRAENGSFTYEIDPQGYDVYRHGRLLRSENFFN